MTELAKYFDIAPDDTEDRIAELKQSGFQQLVMANVTSRLQQELLRRKPGFGIAANPTLSETLGKQFKKSFNKAFWVKWGTWFSVQLNLWLEHGQPCVGTWPGGGVSIGDSPEAWEAFCKDEQQARQYCMSFGAFLAVNDVLATIEVGKVDVEVLESWLGVGTKSAKTARLIRSNLYANRNIEPRPNHAAVSDLLRVLPYPHRWHEHGIELGAAQIQHSKDRYVQYELFDVDSTGDFIPVSPEVRQDTVNSFDWLDHKILSVLLMRSLESCGEKFTLSLNWLAGLISDERHCQKDAVNGKRKYLNRSELLQDLSRRIRRLRMLFLQVKWHEGEGKKKKIYNLLAREGIKRIEFAIFLIPIIYEDTIDGRPDILAEVEPGRWFDFFCQDLRQFTWIPKELFEIDVYRNWRLYAVGQYFLIEYKINVGGLKTVIHDGQFTLVLHRKLSTLIEEVLSPGEIEFALSNRDKGWRLKKGILEDFEFYRKSGCYVGLQYPEGGFKEFMAGTVDFAPPPEAAQAIQNSLDSRPEQKRRPSYRQRVKDAFEAPCEVNGEQIKAARIAKGMTQKDLVTALDAYIEVSQRKISFWESGKSKPTPKEVAKLKLVLNL